MSDNAKRILIIGGTRYCGYHIARSLLADGHAVTIFSRGRSMLFPEGANQILGDRDLHDEFVSTFRGQEFDAVIDMIAYREEDSLATIEAFVGSIGHLVHMSTASVYAVLEDLPSPVREEDFEGVVKLSGSGSKGHEYGMGKRRCETALWRAHAERDLPVTTLRLPIVLGERDPTLRAQSYFLRIMDGEPVILPSGGLNPMSFVYQGDVVDFVTDNIGNSAVIGEALNLAQDEIPTVRTFVEQSAEILGREPDLIDIPTAMLKKVGYRFSGSPFTSKRPFIVDNAKAKRLGFQTTPMNEWLGRTIRYFNADGPGEIPEEYGNREFELSIIDAWRSLAESFESSVVARVVE